MYKSTTENSIFELFKSPEDFNRIIHLANIDFIENLTVSNCSAPIKIDFINPMVRGASAQYNVKHTTSLKELICHTFSISVQSNTSAKSFVLKVSIDSTINGYQNVWPVITTLIYVHFKSLRILKQELKKLYVNKFQIQTHSEKVLEALSF